MTHPNFLHDYLSRPTPEDRLPFAVYGTLMRSDGHPKWTEQYGDYAGPCVIRGELWDVGSFPALLPGEDLVVGQLFVPHESAYEEALHQFDRIEGYRPDAGSWSMYRRERVRLADPEIDVWTYVWNCGKSRLRRIPSGSWAEHAAHDDEPQEPALPWQS